MTNCEISCDWGNVASFSPCHSIHEGHSSYWWTVQISIRDLLPRCEMIISDPELVLSRPDASLPVKGVQSTLWSTIPEEGDRKVFNMTLQSSFLDFEAHKIITVVVMAT